jgi:hypothetical protein
LFAGDALAYIDGELRLMARFRRFLLGSDDWPGLG